MAGPSGASNGQRVVKNTQSRTNNSPLVMSKNDLDAKVFDTAESMAAEVVSIVRDFVEALRNEFRPRQQSQSGLKVIQIYTKLQAISLPEKIESLRRREVLLRGHAYSDNGTGKGRGAEEKMDDVASNFDIQRSMVLLKVALPLAELLASCYGILDNLPELKTKAVPTKPHCGASKIARSRRTKNLPAPPRGMLSIRDYTDVACLLEFIVCTGILPLLEQEGRLSSQNNSNGNRLIEDRLRTKLPKSLAGRIPKDALRWGTSFVSSLYPADNFIQATDAITRVIVLDRFRPMLLPRHLVDVYGAFFQIEYLASNTVHTEKDETDITMTLTKHYKALALPLPESLVMSSSRIASGMTSHLVVVDPTLRAMAFQTILSSSSSSQVSTSKKPREQQQQKHYHYQQWLKKRVSALLTDLATGDIRGLSAILTVFVPVLSSSTDQSSLMSSASQRLGRTLATMVATVPIKESNENGNLLQARLCQQFLELLSAAFAGPGEVTERGNDMAADNGIPPRSMAVIQTAWAFFEHLSHPIVSNYVLRQWESAFLATKNTGNIRETIRQIGALCSFVPPHSKSAVKLLLRAVVGTNNSDGENFTLLGNILRVAMLHKASVASREAQQTLLFITQAIYTGSGTDDFASASNTDKEEDVSRDKTVAAWISGLGPTKWDVEGYLYACKMLPGTDGGVPVEEITRQKHEPLLAPTAMGEFAASVQSTTKRCEFFVEKILLVLSPPISQISNESDAPPTLLPLQGLPSRLFRFLLKLYLSQDYQDQNSVNTSFVPTILLPILCEKCSQEQLLFGHHRANASGLLLLIRQVLFELANPKPQNNNTNDNESKNGHRYELLKSIAGILMSLLIALMEVGSRSRSKEEEHLLQSFLPILQSLSNSSDIHHSDCQIDRRDNAAMADMAAYAMALIASRKSKTSNVASSGTQEKLLSPEERLWKILDEAEKDLGSSQAPIRAKGIVSLGRLARGFTGAFTRDQKVPSLIQELDETSDKETIVGDGIMTDWIEKVIELSIVALDDKESYVYLAAIQTIVAVGDLHPQRVLPKVAIAIVRSKLDPFNTNRDNILLTKTIQLSQEQVIKLAEALMFIIRRRAVTDEYVQMLVNLMLRSGIAETLPKENEAKDGPTTTKEHKLNDSLLIRQETDHYFTTGRFREDEATEKDAYHATTRELWDEQDIRLKTGGPIFAFEEADVVRSLRITILSELVASANSSALVPFSRLFSRVIIESLHLEGDSRIVQRSAALLARELYARIAEEATDLVDALEQQHTGAQGGANKAAPQREVFLPLAVALVEGGEESSLCAVLRSFANREGKSHANNATMVAADPAVVARCSEALALRTEAEEKGAFLASRLVLEERRELERMPSLLLASSTSDVRGNSASGVIVLDPIETLR